MFLREAALSGPARPAAVNTNRSGCRAEGHARPRLCTEIFLAGFFVSASLLLSLSLFLSLWVFKYSPRLSSSPAAARMTF